MFETLFTCPGALRRHREGPLAAERAAYLSELATQGMARGTILRRSSYCLSVAIELERSPPERCFDEDELEELASAWAAQRHACGRASSLRWPNEHFRFAATTNRYAEVDLEMKAQALETCAVTGPDPAPSVRPGGIPTAG